MDFSTLSNALSQNAASNGADMKNSTFYTALKFTKQALDILNNMTFIYNPNWTMETDGGTLPVAFFSVVGMHEMFQSETTEKPLLFYNSGTDAKSKIVSNAVMNVVADNIINKPKTYNLDILIPYEQITLLLNMPFMDATQFASIMDVISNGGEASGMSSFINNIAASLAPYKEVIETILTTLVNMDVSSVGAFVSSMTSQPGYNKNALEQMWRSRRILKMKTWNSGWKYKSVVIESMDLYKNPDEAGIYRGNLTVKEIPILTFRRVDKTAKLSTVVNPIQKLLGKAAITVLDGLQDILGNGGN